MKRREALIVCGGGVVGIALPGVARAWVPGSDYILGKVFERRKNLKSLTVKGRLYVYDESLPGGRREVEQTIHLKPPAMLRLEVRAPKGEYVEVSDGHKTVTVRDGKAGEPKADEADLWRALMIGDVLTLQATARKRAVDLQKVSLGRLDGPEGEPRRGDVCYVIGALAGEEEPAQIWVDKSTFQPRLLKDAGKGARTTAFDGWQEEVSRGWFPAVTTRRRGGEVVQELRAEEVETNPKLAASLFDVKAVASANP